MEPIRDLDAGTLRRVDWRELIPITLLLKALTLSVRLIPVAAVTFLVTFWFEGGLAKWSFFGLFGPFAEETPEKLSCLDATNWGLALQALLPADWVSGLNEHGGWPILGIAALLVTVLLYLFTALMTARASAVRLASTERASFRVLIRFAARRVKSLVLAILLPILLAGLCLLPVWLIGLFPAYVSTALMPLDLFCSFLAILLLAGLVFAMPMMVSAIAADGCDGFDAFSRSFSYLYQRPFHYLFYLLILILLGLVGLAVTALFSWLIPILTDFAGNYYAPGMIDGTPLRPWWRFWHTFLMMLPLGFVFVYKYTAFTAIYLMLRRSVDDVPFDVFASLSKEKPHKLPAIHRDEKGVPVIEEPVSQTTENTQKTEGTDSTAVQ